MATIAILRGDKPDAQSEAVKTFEGLRAIGKDEYILIPYREIIFEITSDSVTVTYHGQDLADFELVYIRDFQGYEHERNAVAQYLQHHKKKFVNADVATFQHVSKLTQYVAFALESIPIPSSLYGHGEALKAAINAKFDFPIIVKSITANSGDDNFLVSNAGELDEILNEHSSKKLIAQEVIPNEGDLRIIVLGDRVGCVYGRVAKPGDHRNNVSQGGDKQYYSLDEIPVEHLELAIKAAHVVNREICGVDLMVDTRTAQPIVLEANFNFGIRAVPGVLSEELHGLADYLHERAAE